MKLSEAGLKTLFAAHHLVLDPHPLETGNGDIILEIAIDPIRAIQFVSAKTYDENASEDINPFLGLRNHQIHKIAANLNLPRECWQDFTAITFNLHHCCVNCDALYARCVLIFRSPKQDALQIVDATLSIDDNALVRQAQIAKAVEASPEQLIAQAAAQWGADYIGLNGNGQVGCIVNGAGLGMATIDAVSAQHLQPAFFLDIHDNFQTETIIGALELTLRHPLLAVVILNLFNMHHSGETLASLLLDAHRLISPALPLIVRIGGHQAKHTLFTIEQARQENIHTALSLQSAAHKAQALLRKEGVFHGNPHS